MSVHPTITAALAEQRRRDMIADAEAHRIARAARAGRPGPVRPMRVILQLIGAVRRQVARLRAVKAPAAADAGSES